MNFILDLLVSLEPTCEALNAESISCDGKISMQGAVTFAQMEASLAKLGPKNKTPPTPPIQVGVGAAANRL